jgi:hypothetical protein
VHCGRKIEDFSRIPFDKSLPLSKREYGLATHWGKMEPGRMGESPVVKQAQVIDPPNMPVGGRDSERRQAKGTQEDSFRE